MKKLHTIAAILFACVISAFPLQAAGKVLILDYHTFLGSDSSIDFTLADFAAQLDRIRDLGYRFVTLEDAMAGNIEGEDNIALTIDDGNHSVWQAFNEVIKPRNLRPELFIYPSVIWSTPHFLKPDQLKALIDGGCFVGAHGYHHNYMSARAYRKDSKDVLDEARKPGPSLEKLTGLDPHLFAYPFGVAGPEARDAVKVAGYSWAFLADEHFVWVDPADPALDHWAVPRTIVYHWNKEALFRHLAERKSHRN
jgi:peptidoglycan/xylan/chitin deacetylase (PgdA/CDA1 family)